MVVFRMTVLGHVILITGKRFDVAAYRRIWEHGEVPIETQQLSQNWSKYRKVHDDTPNCGTIRKGNVILMKCSALAALEVVILSTFSAVSDGYFSKWQHFSFNEPLRPDAWPGSVQYWAFVICYYVKPTHYKETKTLPKSRWFTNIMCFVKVTRSWIIIKSGRSHRYLFIKMMFIQ